MMKKMAHRADKRSRLALLLALAMVLNAVPTPLMARAYANETLPEEEPVEGIEGVGEVQAAEPEPAPEPEPEPAPEPEPEALFSVMSVLPSPAAAVGTTSPSAIATWRFYGEDNTTVLLTQKVKQGDVVYAPATPQREGHVFVGWATVPGATTADLAPFDSMEAAEQAQGGEVSFYPVFAEKRYVFFHHPNGSVLQTKEGVQGDVISTDDVELQVDSEHRVSGWYVDEALTQQVTSVTLGSQDVALYPKVEAGSYITFHREHGASYFEPQFVAPGEVTLDPGAPTRKGYSFKGWTTTQGSTTPDFSFGSPLSGSITLYAIWEPVQTTYTVRVFKQSATDSKDAPEQGKSYVYTDSHTLSALTGSSVSSADLAAAYAIDHCTLNPNRAMTATVEGDGTTVVDLYYDRNLITVSVYTITTNEDGIRYGVSANGSPASIQELTRAADGGWLYNGNPYTGRLFELNTYTGLLDNTVGQYGYVEPNIGSHTLRSVRVSTGEATHTNFNNMFGANRVVWTGETYSLVEFIPSGSSQMAYYFFQDLNGDYSTSAFVGGPFSGAIQHANSQRGYTLVGYRYKIEDVFHPVTSFPLTVSYSYVADDATYMYFDLNSYTLSYYNHDGVGKVESLKYTASLADYGSYVPSQPTSLVGDYEFKGWYLDEDLTVEATFSGTMPADNIIVYAKWEKGSHTVTVHKDLDPNGQTQALSVAHFDTVDRVALNDIFESQKWAVRGDDGSLAIFNFDTQITHDIELYPVSESAAAYSVTYDMAGGSGAVSDPNGYMSLSWAKVLGAQGATKDGRPFLKWVAGGVSYYPGSSIQVTGDVTLVAVYGDAVAQTSLTYKANGGDGADYSVLGIENNDTIAVAPLAETGITRTGYSFLGWSLAADGSGQIFQPGDSITVDNRGENVLYAIWEKDEVPATPATTRKASLPSTGESAHLELIAAASAGAVLVLGGLALVRRRATK